MRRHRAVWPTVAAASVLSALWAAPSHAGFAPARRTHAPELKPPVAQAVGHVEGWAEVCVTVGVDGTVTDARVIDAGPGVAFADAGRSAARGWRYEPARLDGEAVEQHGVCGVQLFTISVKPEEATEDRLAEAERLVDANEGERAARILDELATEGPLTLEQGAELQLLRYRVAETAKDGQTAAMRALDRAAIEGGRFLPEDERVDTLSARFAALVAARRYREALELFGRFESIEGGAKPMVVLGTTAAEIRALVGNDKSFVVPARLEPALGGEGGVWRHRPLRRELGARRLDGKLDALVLVCDLRTMRLDFQEDVSWKIPESWGDCTFYAEGTPGTSFELIEYAVPTKTEEGASDS